MKNKKYWRLIAIVFVSCFIAPFLARAGSVRVYCAPSPSAPAVQDDVIAKILIDSDVALNAYAIKLHYDPAVLDFISSDQGNSIIDIWQNIPSAENGVVSFRGGSIGPFSGTGGELLALTFRAKQAGKTSFQLENAAAYAADGKGTLLVPRTEGCSVIVSRSLAGGISASSPANLISPPSPTISELSLTHNPFDTNEKLLGFLVRDASGIKETAVRYKTFLFWTDWAVTGNPAKIPARAWEVGFRAVNNQGGISEKNIYDFSVLLIPGLVAVVCAVVLMFLFFLFIRWKRYKNLVKEYEDVVQ